MTKKELRSIIRESIRYQHITESAKMTNAGVLRSLIDFIEEYRSIGFSDEEIKADIMDEAGSMGNLQQKSPAFRRLIDNLFQATPSQLRKMLHLIPEGKKRLIEEDVSYGVLRRSILDTLAAASDMDSGHWSGASEVGSIAQRVGERSATVLRILNDLEKAGLVEKMPKHTKRAPTEWRLSVW